MLEWFASCTNGFFSADFLYPTLSVRFFLVNSSCTILIILLQQRMEDTNGAMIKLAAYNYTLWKPRMEDLLYHKDYYDPI